MLRKFEAGWSKERKQDLYSGSQFARSGEIRQKKKLGKLRTEFNKSIQRGVESERRVTKKREKEGEDRTKEVDRGLRERRQVNRKGQMRRSKLVVKRV